MYFKKQTNKKNCLGHERERKTEECVQTKGA